MRLVKGIAGLVVLFTMYDNFETVDSVISGFEMLRGYFY